MFLSDSKSDHRNRVLKVPLARDPRVVSRARESRCGGVSDGAGLQRKPQVLDCAARAIGRYRPRIAGLISKPSVPENVAPHRRERNPVGLSAVLTPPGIAPRSPVIT